MNRQPPNANRTDTLLPYSTLFLSLITLVGLAAKNAILIVEFAVLSRQRGRTIVEAAEEAAQLRFRPIVMTSLAFILGVVPLAISTGAGDRKSTRLNSSH